jgi:hypothetical protein
LAITWKSGRGVVSPSFLRSDEQLVLGNQLLGTQDQDYLQKRTQYRNSLHTLDAVMQSLENVARPRDWVLPEGIETARDVFVGYLMLDALIANGDRHDENWAVVRETSGTQLALAPTFDHASSLGALLLDEERHKRLTTKDRGYSVLAYVEKGTSALYKNIEDKKRLTQVMAFVEAAHTHRQAAHVWLAQLAKLTQEDFEEGLGKIPKNRISSVAIDFALQLLSHNVSRLRQAL